MTHQCKALVITCIDYRFRSDIRDFLISLGLKDDYDMVSLAGSTKDLVDGDPAGSEIIMKEIEISNRLHKMSEIYILHHMDCGAYGGSKSFKSKEEERIRQLEDMELARTKIAVKFPQIEVKKVLARIDEQAEDNKIDFELV